MIAARHTQSLTDFRQKATETLDRRWLPRLVSRSTCPFVCSCFLSENAATVIVATIAINRTRAIPSNLPYCLI